MGAIQYKFIVEQTSEPVHSSLLLHKAPLPPIVPCVGADVGGVDVGALVNGATSS